jgi:hypothetical protein
MPVTSVSVQIRNTLISTVKADAGLTGADRMNAPVR